MPFVGFEETEEKNLAAFIHQLSKTKYLAGSSVRYHLDEQILANHGAGKAI